MFFDNNAANHWRLLLLDIWKKNDTEEQSTRDDDDRKPEK